MNSNVTPCLGNGLTLTEYFKPIKQRGYGTYYVEDKRQPHPSPLSMFELSPNFPIIPRDLYSALLRLFVHMAAGSEPLEVSTMLLRSENLKHWKIVVPKQVVTSTSVTTSTESVVDLISGEESAVFPPEGWYSGSSWHQHHVMQAFYSSTDDQSDRDSPGLHLVTGSLQSIWQHTTIASVMCKDKRRRMVPLNKVVDTVITEQNFHPGVLKQITTPEVRTYEPSGYRKPTTPATQKPAHLKSTAEYLLLELVEELQYLSAEGKLDEVSYLQELAIDMLVENLDPIGAIEGSNTSDSDPFFFSAT